MAHYVAAKPRAAKPWPTRLSRRGLASCRGKAARGKPAYNLVIDNLCIYFRNHSLISYSDDYVSVDLAITFVILDTLNMFLID